MTESKQDPPELQAGIEMLRSIYWREYGRGWREACQRVKEILEREPPIYGAETVAEVRKVFADGELKHD